ncbi:MAG TPA: trimethylamine methyltransferase, partial [Aliiroseovarius sp.]|nr:trimethylamine methyltransferase [Aliiroseovarius sp.]
YKTAFWASELDDNRPWETWDEQGGQDMAARANARWKKVPAQYEAPQLDGAVDGALIDYIARKKADVADAWY